MLANIKMSRLWVKSPEGHPGFPLQAFHWATPHPHTGPPQKLPQMLLGELLQNLGPVMFHPRFGFGIQKPWFFRLSIVPSPFPAWNQNRPKKRSSFQFCCPGRVLRPMQMFIPMRMLMPNAHVDPQCAC